LLSLLPGLIRATAVNASRAKRSSLTYYQQHWEERNRALETITAKHVNRSSFEAFAASMYVPEAADDFIGNSGSGGSSSSSRRPASLIASASLGESRSSKYLRFILCIHCIELSNVVCFSFINVAYYYCVRHVIFKSSFITIEMTSCYALKVH